MTRKVLFRCDAGAAPELGTGHLVRDLLLASRLRQREIAVSFCGRYDDRALERIREAGFEIEQGLPDDRDPELVHRAVVRYRPDVLVFDHLNTELDEITSVRDLVPVIVTFDDLGPGAAVADVVINAIVGEGEPYSAFEYLVLPPPEPRPFEQNRPPQVVVSVGGDDHRGLGPPLAAAIRSRVDANVTLVGAVGDGSAQLDGVTVIQDPPSFSALLREADVAVTNGGLTMLEALANGIPSVAVPQHPHQSATIARLAGRGAVEPAANDIELSVEDLAESVGTAVARLVDDETERRRIRERALMTIDGRGLDRVADLVSVVDRLAWDSDFFGVEIAYLRPTRVTQHLLSFALARCEEMGIHCVYYLCDCHHAESVRLVEAAGFNFVDIRLTFERDVPGDAEPVDGIRDATADDLPALQRIAEDSYVHSRYWFDNQFPRADCERFYADWITKCVLGEQAEGTFVLDQGGGDPAGYVAVRRLSSVVAAIVLVGVDSAERGAGAGRSLIDHALWWAREAGCSRIEVVTQGRNYQAQRAYERAGFITKKTELWYHLWRR